MYIYAYNKRDELQLTPAEAYDTKTRMWAHLILFLVAIVCIVITFILPVDRAGTSGFAYFFIVPAATIFHSIRGRKRRQLFKTDV